MSYLSNYSTFSVRTFLAAIAIVVATLAPISTATAADPPPAQLGQIDMDSTKDAWGKIKDLMALKQMSDIEKRFFRVIFGDVPLIPSDKQNGIERSGAEKRLSVLTKVGGWTNIVAILFILIISSYVISAGVINSANTGEVLGKKWSSSWVFMKTSIAMLMLVPIKGLPFSSAQLMIIYISAVGSAAGTATAKDVSDTTIDSIEMSAKGYSLPPTIGQDLMAMMTCGDEENRKEDTFFGFSTGSEEKKPFYTYTQVSHVGGDNKGAVKKTTVKVSNKNLSSENPFEAIAGKQAKPITGIHFGDTGSCGSLIFSYQSIKKERKNLGDQEKVVAEIRARMANNAANAGREYIVAILDLLSRQMRPVIENHSMLDIYLYAAREESNPSQKVFSDVNAATSRIASVLSGISGGYVDSVDNATKKDQEDLKAQLTGRFSADSWMTLGKLFFDLSRASQYPVEALSNAMTSVERRDIHECLNVNPDAPEDSDLAENFEDCKEYFAENNGSGDRVGGEMLGDILFAQTIAGHSSLDTMQAVSSTYDCASLVCGGLKPSLEGIMKQPSGPLVGLLNTGAALGSLGSNHDDESFISTGGFYNPFFFLMNLGHTINGMAMTLWGVGLTMSVMTGGIGGMFASALSGGAASYILGSVSVIILALLPLGVVLAYVIPLTPLLNWVTAIAGWVLSTIEAYFAVPFAFAMMALPEGQGVFGSRLERAIALIARVLLYPILLVLGFVAAVSAANFLFAFFNLMFWNYGEVETWTPVGMIAILASYVMSLFYLARYIFSFMAKVVDQILEWMSGGIARKFGEEDATGTLSQGLGSTAQFNTSTTTSGMAATKKKR